ncbi:1,2-dihydroxy-3-keto-5-methylthiopentene dioxygenase [Actinomadura alba]|uniref:Acireductone dioxygenase n=1 Tax=Actinomadura alba TaxID=406431 RepID=A0ABR7LMJ0_9ACTN|nr:cupin [Actinomadura alba]MBC6465960.1 cupin [Actinomadura alba]
MTLLTTWHDDQPGTFLDQTSDPDRIGALLGEIGIRFERWASDAVLAPDAGEAEVLAAYREQVDKLIADEGFATVDVVALRPSDDPEWRAKAKAARAKFLDEHTHDDDDEVRFFVHGAGVFYLHIDGKVHAVLCEAGDLLGVPKGTTHWFDMGTVPDFAAIRFFHEEDGWIGTFTGSDISRRFPDFDTLKALV